MNALKFLAGQKIWLVTRDEIAGLAENTGVRTGRATEHRPKGKTPQPGRSHRSQRRARAKDSARAKVWARGEIGFCGGNPGMHGNSLSPYRSPAGSSGSAPAGSRPKKPLNDPHSYKYYIKRKKLDVCVSGVITCTNIVTFVCFSMVFVILDNPRYMDIYFHIYFHIFIFSCIYSYILSLIHHELSTV